MRDDPLLEALSASAIARGLDATPQHLATTAWAFAPLRWAHSPSLSAIAAAALDTCSEFEPRSSSNLVWALALLQVQHPPLLAAIASASLPRLSEFNSQALSNTAWSFAVLCSRDHRPLMEALSSAALTRSWKDIFGTKHSYAVLWTMWMASESEPSLFDKLQSFDVDDD